MASINHTQSRFNLHFSLTKSKLCFCAASSCFVPSISFPKQHLSWQTHWQLIWYLYLLYLVVILYYYKSIGQDKVSFKLVLLWPPWLLLLPIQLAPKLPNSRAIFSGIFSLCWAHNFSSTNVLNSWSVCSADDALRQRLIYDGLRYKTNDVSALRIE